LAFLAVWLVLFFFFTEPSPKAYWIGPGVREFVTQSLKEFCTDLYGDGVCPDTRITGKKVWLAISVFGASGITTQQTESILILRGWQKLASNNDRIVSFCKSGHGAKYEYAAGFVNSITFIGGTHACEKLVRKE